MSLLALAGPALAGPRIESFRGHLAFGYAALIESGAPGGSLSAGAGIDYPVATGLNVGIDVGFHLLGSSLVERGSLGAELDYSLFEALLLAHWTLQGSPFRLSAGPGLLHARADLSSSGAGLFGDLAVGETGPGFGVTLTAMPRRETPLRAGIEVGVRTALLEDDTWTVAIARLTVHY